MIKVLGPICEGLKSISLDEMDSVKLMDRIDSKFLLAADRLPQILNQSADKFRILEVDGVRISPYNTVYFDTTSNDMYHNHINKRAKRYKIRCRQYISSGLSFTEIKIKNNKGKTSKKRVKTNTFPFPDENASKLIEAKTPFKANDLKLMLENRFSRITLVDNSMKERITLDFNLQFKNKDKLVDMSALAIAEVKSEGKMSLDGFGAILKANSIHPSGFSKYCAGMALLHPQLKQNSIKQRLRYIQKLLKQTC
jgi:hypothetical protein